MRHENEAELLRLEHRFKTVGLNKKENQLRSYLLRTKKNEVESLATQLSGWANRTKVKV